MKILLLFAVLLLALLACLGCGPTYVTTRPRPVYVQPGRRVYIGYAPRRSYSTVHIHVHYR